MNQAARAADGGRSMTRLGIITIILGILVMLAPVFTAQSIMIIIGILVAAGGVVRMIWALQAGSLGKGLLAFAIGLLTLLCGIALVANPLFASGLLTIILVLYLLIDGLFELAAGFNLRPEAGWVWLVFGGFVSIVLGIMLWKQYPLSGFWAVGVFLGIKLLMAGIMMITTGTVVRQALKS